MTNIDKNVARELTDSELESVAAGSPPSLASILQGASNGAKTGSAVGKSIAGDIGGAIGGAIGAVVGAVESVFE